jgi:long-chain fatty acid transport protein
VTIPYSSKTDWGIDWAGRQIIAGSEQRGIVVTPMVAFRATSALSLGVGIDITSFRLTRSARILQGVPPDALVEGTERMQGDGTVAYGVQIGLLLQPGEALILGLAYRTRSTVSISGGSVTYEWPASVPAGSLKATDKFKTSFTLPDKIRGGIGLRPIEPVLLSGELEFTRWSSIEEQIMYVGDPVTRGIVEQKDWKDILAARLGAEIILGDVAVRAGIIFDRSPVSDQQLRPSIPDADRTAYTAGIGYAIGERLTLDVAIQSVRYDDRIITNSAQKAVTGLPLNGTYVMNATVVGLNVSYSWK